MKLSMTRTSTSGQRLRMTVADVGKLITAAAMAVLCTGAFMSSALAQNWLINPPAELGRECAYGDCENGFGILEIRTELGTNRYEGNFQAGEFHGHGRVEIMVSRNDLAYYEGDWVMGVRDGRGTYWDGVSNLYIGQWRNDLRHGRGAYFFGVQDWTPNRHSEQWLQNNVENYTGEFVDDLYEGAGTYRWPDGARYEGEFFANEKHGNGTFFYPTGTRREQHWQYGRFIR